MKPTARSFELIESALKSITLGGLPPPAFVINIERPESFTPDGRRTFSEVQRCFIQLDAAFSLVQPERGVG